MIHPDIKDCERVERELSSLRIANERLEKERLDWKMQWAEAHERALQAHRQLLTTEKELAAFRVALKAASGAWDDANKRAEAARLEVQEKYADIMLKHTLQVARLAQVEGALEATRKTLKESLVMFPRDFFPKAYASLCAALQPEQEKGEK